MTNKEKALKRERIRLRKNQNPQQVDYKRMDKVRSVKTEYWKMKRHSGIAEKKAITKPDDKKPKPKKEKKKKEKEPELEVVEEKPELEVIEDEPELEEITEDDDSVEIDKELEELYSDDDDVDEETEPEEVEEPSEWAFKSKFLEYPKG